MDDIEEVKEETEQFAEIVDVRMQSDFRNTTFSEYSKSGAKRELISSLMNNRIEESCYWSCQFICAGHFIELWEIIIHYYSKYIHTANIKLAVYLDARLDCFMRILGNGYVGREIYMRNNEKVRELFCEIITILAVSNKYHTFIETKIDKEVDFDLTKIIDKFKAPNNEYYKRVLTSEDPKEIIIAMNEFIYSLESKNCVDCYYWLEWIIELINTRSKMRGEKLVGMRRTYLKKVDNNQFNVIWAVWEAILLESENAPTIIQKIVSSLLNIFCFYFSTPSIKKHKYVMYFAISLVTNNVVVKNDNIIADKDKLAMVMAQINNIYLQLKRSEVKPNTEYLFANLKKSNLEQTMAKIDKMNEFSDNFIPRT